MRKRLAQSKREIVSKARNNGLWGKFDWVENGIVHKLYWQSGEIAAEIRVCSSPIEGYTYFMWLPFDDKPLAVQWAQSVETAKYCAEKALKEIKLST